MKNKSSNKDDDYMNQLFVIEEPSDEKTISLIDNGK